MSNTSPLGWPYMDGSDSASSIAASVKGTVLAIDTTVGDFTADTGWINITGLSSGWSNDTYIPQVRQVGNRVMFQGGVVDSIFSTTTFLKVFSLPSGIGMPTGTRVYPLFGPTGRGARILTTGEVDFYANGASSFAFSLDGISYMTN